MEAWKKEGRGNFGALCNASIPLLLPGMTCRIRGSTQDLQNQNLSSMSPRWLICSLKCETCCLKDPHTSRQHAYCSLLETRRWALLISPIYLCVLKRKTRGRNVRVRLGSAFLFFFKHLAGGIDFSLPLLL